MSARQDILLEIARDRALAHAVLFNESHTEETPKFHLEILSDWYSPHGRVVTQAFRDAGKSTLAEEAITITGCMKEARNIIIIGENEDRANDRLRKVKHAIDNNEMLQYLFEIGRGSIWGETKAVLSNGVIIQAYGRGQSLRGAKYLDWRPDLIFCDDLETEESVKTPAARLKVSNWFFKTVMGALAKGGRMRVVGTPLDPDALIPNLAKNPSWLSRMYPIEYASRSGERMPMWPDKYPMEWIDEKKLEMSRAGKSDGYQQEYMCQAVDPATRVFKAEDFRFATAKPSWHGVYAVYDPARTVHQKSATTGKVVFSWVKHKLVFWEADAQKWLPSQLIADIFDVNARYDPVLIGVEETGLNEWVREPLRQEQVRRAELLPLRALNAPRGKLDFIKGLQPFFRAGQVEFANNDAGMQLFQQQLLSFPTGEIDAPNAGAYALTLQPQQLVYDAFDGDVHIDERLAPVSNAVWLAVNATSTITTAVLVQIQSGVIRVLADWMREGDPGAVLADTVKEAQLEAAAPGLRLPAKGASSTTASLRLVAPAEHWNEYDTIGLRGTASRIPISANRGGPQASGRDELREAMTHSVHGVPAFQVSSNARWTLRALAGGYAWRHKKGQLELVEGPYSVLMAGLEAFAGLIRNQEDDNEQHYSYTAQGRKYLSALAR